MQDGADAYANTARITDSPRDLEGSLLLKAASRLQGIKDAWPRNRKPTDLNDALHYNRHLWTVFLSAATRDENPLPTEIKSNIASLATFIFNQTLTVQRDPAPDKLAPLIQINREIAAGLHGST